MIRGDARPAAAQARPGRRLDGAEGRRQVPSSCASSRWPGRWAARRLRRLHAPRHGRLRDEARAEPARGPRPAGARRRGGRPIRPGQRVSEAGHYVFAHRSLHEYLVAEELLALPDGEATLLDRATDPEWRQVVLFFAAASGPASRATYSCPRSPLATTLAGHCLAGPMPSDGVAEPILERVADRRHRPPDRTGRRRRPRRGGRCRRWRCAGWSTGCSVVDAQRPRERSTATSTACSHCWDALAGRNAARIAALVPQIVATRVPDDPRLVEPLWRCLTVPGIERTAATRAIVERLLGIAMNTDGFDALKRQEPYTRPFLDESIRDRAYPFKNGLPKTCNLVTLLTWAEYLDALPSGAQSLLCGQGGRDWVAGARGGRRASNSQLLARSGPHGSSAFSR